MFWLSVRPLSAAILFLSSCEEPLPDKPCDSFWGIFVVVSFSLMIAMSTSPDLN